MSKGVSTAGMKLGYAVAASASLPTSATFTKIPEVKTMPNFNPAPSGIDITPLDEMESKQYTPDLKDLGGVLEFGANLTNELTTLWNDTVLTAYGSMSSTSAMWFCVSHPKLTKAVYFQGEPVALGLNEASVGSAAETTLYIAPKSAPTMGTKPASF